MQLSRRNLLTNLGYTVFLAASGMVAGLFARFLTPNLVTPAPGPIEVGVPEEYSIGSLIFIESARSYLGHDDKGYYAIVAICTHLGCAPRLETDGFVCPCHGSRFARDGQVINSPATRPLDRAYVGRTISGKLLVDRSRVVDANYRLKV